MVSKEFRSFFMIRRKPHVACSICLRAKIFQNPEETLWTHGKTTLTFFFIEKYQVYDSLINYDKR
jgi:hypothetical protein